MSDSDDLVSNGGGPTSDQIKAFLDAAYRAPMFKGPVIHLPVQMCQVPEDFIWDEASDKPILQRCGKPATTTWVYTTLGYRIPVCEEHARELREKNTPKPKFNGELASGSDALCEELRSDLREHIRPSSAKEAP